MQEKQNDFKPLFPKIAALRTSKLQAQIDLDS